MQRKRIEKIEIIRGVTDSIYTIKNAALLLNLTAQRVRQLRDAFLYTEKALSYMVILVSIRQSIALMKN